VNVDREFEREDQGRRGIAGLLPWRRADRNPIPRLLRTKRGRAGTVGRIADRVRRGDELSNSDVDLLLQTARTPFSWCWREREAAAWALGEAALSPKQAEKAVRALESAATLSDEEKGSPGRTGPHLLRLATTAAILTAVVPGREIARIPGTGDKASAILAGLVVFSFLAALPVLTLSYFVERDRLRAVRAVATRALGNFGTASSLSVALINASDHGACVSTAALDVLPRILDRVAAGTPQSFPADEARRLCKLLNSDREQLVISILNALGRAGGGSAVLPVERLVKKGSTEAVRRLAEETLPILQERLRAEQAPAVLLRASQPPAADSTELLRAARAEPQVDPNTLLRPGMSDRSS
jgi:hypothetical protein